MKYIKTYEEVNSNLLIVTKLGFLSLVKELIEAGANIDFQDDDGETALMIASNFVHIEIVRELIKAGADWNIKDNDNRDFLDHLLTVIKKQIIEEFPEKYQNYLIKKDAEKYNL